MAYDKRKSDLLEDEYDDLSESEAEDMMTQDKDRDVLSSDNTQSGMAKGGRATHRDKPSDDDEDLIDEILGEIESEE